MARTFKNSTVVRLLHNHPTESWFDLVAAFESAVWCATQGEVSTCPGPAAGEIDWMFELESDAVWFLLKHGGRIVDPNEISLKSLMIGFG